MVQSQHNYTYQNGMVKYIPSFWDEIKLLQRNSEHITMIHMDHHCTCSYTCIISMCVQGGVLDHTLQYGKCITNCEHYSGLGNNLEAE